MSPASFRNNLAARFASDIYTMVTSLVAATISARALGPAGRGYYASLTLLSVLFGQLFNLGLGEAAVVLPGRGKTPRSVAVSATIAVLVPLGVLGGLTCILVGFVTLDVVTTSERAALGLAGLLVLLNSSSNSLAWLVASRERLVALAVIMMMSATLMTVILYVFVAVLDLGVSGAILASVLAIAFTIIPMLRILARQGISLKPVWNGPYLRSAARFGTTLQLSNALVQMAARLDLLFVYRITSASAAGMYSVSLTIGALVGSVPIAIAYASFPRLSHLSEDDARELIARLFRVGVSAAIACSVGLAVLTPLVIPLLFGRAYSGATVPTLLLIPAGVAWSGQWILCRASASREMATPLFVSFLASFLTMVALDLVLIRPFGIVGAALASLISSTVGFAIALGYHIRAGWSWRPFLPRPGDLSLMVTTVRQLTGSLRGRSPASTGSDSLESRPGSGAGV